LGFYDLKGEKATTVALERLRDKKIQVVEE
jgi:hypothetical protein